MPNNPPSHDPREAGAKPPMQSTQQPHPGSDATLSPAADHGETSYKGNGRLEGRVAIITGGDSGIGRAVAIAFAKEGADIVFSSLPEEKEDAEETTRQVEKTGRKVIHVPGDIRQLSHAQQLVDTATKEFGRLDVVVNNAGFQRTHEGLLDLPAEEIERTFATNVFGTFYLSQAALPKLKKGGVILNTCSIEAFTPATSLLAYASTKAALVNFTKGLAKVVGEQGIRVNGVAPGPVWTPLIPSTMPEEKVKQFGENTVFKRPAQPIEMATVFVFLASDDASYVSGEIYGATGGRMPV